MLPERQLRCSSISNELHASDAIYSYYDVIFAISFVPTFLLYGFLCKKVSLNKLLWWGTIVAVPQMIPLAFIHSANLALVMAVPIVQSWPKDSHPLF